jgi:hypothetical protein
MILVIIVIYLINTTEFNESITFYVNTTIVNETPVVVPVIETPRSSGGGGGSCTTKWNCSEWSECQSSGTQSRVCSYKTNYCKPTSIKPNETQSCNYIKPVVVEPEEVKQPEPPALIKKSKRELNLKDYVDKTITVKLRSNRVVKGKVKKRDSTIYPFEFYYSTYTSTGHYYTSKNKDPDDIVAIYQE